jgi:hypothetical protein
MIRPAISSGSPRRPSGICGRILAGIPQMTPELREYYCFSFFPGRQTRGADGYRHPRAGPNGGRAADLAIFPGIGTVRSGGIALTMSLCSATGSRAAANSIASGIPSNFSHLSDDRGVRIGKLEFVVPRTIGREVESLGLAVGGLSSGDRRCTCSPSVRNGSRLVARPAPP